MTDDEFLAAFEACSLPREAWTHQAHVRMAWLYLDRLPLADSRRVVSAGIQRYNRARVSKPLAYHETITQAYLNLIAARREAGESFSAFCARNADLLDRRLTALLVHYRPETLFSDLARQTFMPPDLVDFPDPAASSCQPPKC